MTDSPSFQALGAHDPVPPPLTGQLVDAEQPPGSLRILAGHKIEPDTPLAYLLDIMEREPDADFSPEQRLYHERMRLEAAKTAAPFLHPRLAQIEHRGKVALSHEQALADLDEA